MSKNRGIAQLALRIGALLAFLVSACQADVIAGGYNFTNFDSPGSGTNAGAGTNANGIANNGAAVGFGIDNAGNFTNFVRNANGTLTTLNINGSTAAMAFGINSAGDVVGTDGIGNAFFLPPGGQCKRSFREGEALRPPSGLTITAISSANIPWADRCRGFSWAATVD